MKGAVKINTSVKTKPDLFKSLSPARWGEIFNSSVSVMEADGEGRSRLRPAFGCRPIQGRFRVLRASFFFFYLYTLASHTTVVLCLQLLRWMIVAAHPVDLFNSSLFTVNYQCSGRSWSWKNLCRSSRQRCHQSCVCSWLCVCVCPHISHIPSTEIFNIRAKREHFWRSDILAGPQNFKGVFEG